jgi:hypothetical protein
LYQAAQQPLSEGRNAYENLATVLLGPFAHEQPPLLHTIDKLDGTLVADLQTFGKVPNRGLLTVGQAAQS